MLTSLNSKVRRFGTQRSDAGTKRNGDVAQLGERRNGIAEVRGSIPLVSTTIRERLYGIYRTAFCHWARTGEAVIF
jgi:hypothetical protein